MKKIIIVLIITILLVGLASLMIFNILEDKEETGYVLYTDGPDENGDGMIDGEVFFVDPKDLP